MAEPSVSPGSSSETQLCSQPVHQWGHWWRPNYWPAGGAHMHPQCLCGKCSEKVLPDLPSWGQSEAGDVGALGLPDRSLKGLLISLLLAIGLPTQCSIGEGKNVWPVHHLSFINPTILKKDLFFSFYFLALHSSQMTILLLPLKMFFLSLFLFGKLL